MVILQLSYLPPGYVTVPQHIFYCSDPCVQLLAIMLRNSSENFISQTTSRKFLDTLEEILSSPRTCPTVREFILDVVAAAAYASGNSKLIQM